MSEIIQGALIGIAGVIVGAISSYIITRLQINARRDELKQQLEHQEREAKINRLIEARKERLSQLIVTISEYLENANQVTNMSVRLDVAHEKKASNEHQELIGLIDVLEHGKELTSRLAILRGNISDNRLDDLITAFLERQREMDILRRPLIEFGNNPKGADIDTIESISRKEESLRDAQRKELIKINKRIEELLSGEPSG